MKLKEKYKELKNSYHDAIVLIKSGSFYVTFDVDAVILNYLFSYQINNSKVGFPLKNIERVTDELNIKRINYVVWSDDEHVDVNIDEQNKYSIYFNDAKREEFNIAMNNVLIDRIKFLINENSDNYSKIKRFIDEL